MEGSQWYVQLLWSIFTFYWAFIIANFVYLTLLTKKIEDHERYSPVGNIFFSLIQKYGQLVTVTDEYYKLRDKIERKCFKEIIGNLMTVCSLRNNIFRCSQGLDRCNCCKEVRISGGYNRHFLLLPCHGRKTGPIPADQCPTLTEKITTSTWSTVAPATTDSILFIVECTQLLLPLLYYESRESCSSLNTR